MLASFGGFLAKWLSTVPRGGAKSLNVPRSDLLHKFLFFSEIPYPRRLT